MVVLACSFLLSNADLGKICADWWGVGGMKSNKFSNKTPGDAPATVSLLLVRSQCGIMRPYLFLLFPLFRDVSCTLESDCRCLIVSPMPPPVVLYDAPLSLVLIFSLCLPCSFCRPGIDNDLFLLFPLVSFAKIGSHGTSLSSRLHP